MWARRVLSPFLHRSMIRRALRARLHPALSAAIAGGNEQNAIHVSIALLDYIESFTRAALDAPVNVA